MSAIYRIVGKFILPILRNTFFFLFMYLLGLVCLILGGNICVRAVLELFLDLYVICAFLCIFPEGFRKLLRFLFYFLFYFIAYIDFLCYFNLGTHISPTILQLVLQTNSNEVSEAIQTYSSIRFYINQSLWVILLILIHILTDILCSRCKSLTFVPGILKKEATPIVKALFGFIAFSLFVFSSVMSWANKVGMYKVLSAEAHEIQHIKGSSLPLGFYLPVYKMLFSIKAIYNVYGRITALEQNIKNVAIDKCAFASKNIVLIIGESYNRHHSQLYGYKLETTPFQYKRSLQNELIAFSDVVSSWNYTCESFEQMFSLCSVENLNEWEEKPLFPALFKKAGYNVFFITNQFVQRIDQNIWDFSGGLFLNSNILNNAQFDHRNTQVHQYDIDLIADYDSLKLYSQDYNLIIFHLIGQHVSYRERYPDEWHVFTGKDYHRPDLNDQQMEILVDYDNATRYNDYVIENILNRFEEDDVIAIYLADHGDQCFDGNLSFGRSASIDKAAVTQQFEIPFWVWASPQYRKSHPEIWSSILESKDKPFMTDNLPHILLSLAAISCKEYDCSLDLLSRLYNPMRKRLLRGNVDYDSIVYDRY